MRNRAGRITIMCAAAIVAVAMLVPVTASGQISRRDPEHQLAVALPSPVQFSHTDRFAQEIYYLGESVFHTVFKNTTGQADTFRMDVVNEVVPDGVGTFDWVGFYCDTSGACHFGPHDYVLEPGEAETLDVHLNDAIGTTQGMALTTLTATWGREEVSISFATFVDLPSVLLVDDDAGASHETYLMEAVEDAGYGARPWDADLLGRPELDLLESYRIVLWTTADGSATYIDELEEQKMMDYLDGGGSLMLASMGYLSSRSAANEFTTDYLHLLDWTNDDGGGPAAGISGDPITDGMYLTLDGGPFPAGDGDSMAPEAPALPLFTVSPAVGGVRVDENEHRVAFLGFAIENVGDTAPDPDNRKTLVGRTIDWLDTSPFVLRNEPVGSLVLAQNVPNPFNPHTEIAFNVPENAGHVTLSVVNVSGQVVRTLVNESLPTGPAVAAWDGKDGSGRRAASGIYFARLQAAGETAHRKMLMLK